MRIRPSLMAVVCVLVCAAILSGLYWWRLTRDDTVAELLERFPNAEAPVLFVNVAALRESGLLELFAGDRASEETDYREFVEQIAFDYRTDLDAALVSFDTSGTLFLLRGRFAWSRLTRLALEQNGECINTVCSVRSGLSSRWISFFPATPNLMALASGRTPGIVYALEERYQRAGPESVPDAPFWYSTTGEQLWQAGWLPDGARFFVRALRGAERVTFTVGPAADDFEARLVADCGSDSEARAVTTHLEQLTEELDLYVRREHKEPNPSDLSGVLVAGTFKQDDSRVHGRWPVPLAYLENITRSE